MRFQLFVQPPPRLRTPPSSDRWTVHPAGPASHTHPTGSQGTKAAGRRGPGYQPGSCGLLDRVGQGGGGPEVARSPDAAATEKGSEGPLAETKEGAHGSWGRGGGHPGALGPYVSRVTALRPQQAVTRTSSRGRGSAAAPPSGLGKGAAVSSGRVAQGAPAEGGRGAAVRGGSETQATAATTGRRPSTARSFPEHLAAPAPVPASHPHPPGARSTPTPGLPCWSPSRLHPPALGSFTHPPFSVPSFPLAQS